jgi:hypothetical protein
MLFIKNQMVLSVTMVTEFRGDDSLARSNRSVVSGLDQYSPHANTRRNDPACLCFYVAPKGSSTAKERPKEVSPSGQAQKVPPLGGSFPR